MAARTEAYVDTSALIAFADRSDSHHPLFRRLFSEPHRLITTTLVIAEGHGWFLKRFDQTRALQFLALVDLMRPLKVLAAGAAQQRAGAEYLRRFSDQRLTLVDAVELHFMDEREVVSCWSTDFHLGLTGIPLVVHAK